MADNFRSSKYDELLRSFDPYVHAVTVITEPHRLIHDGFFFQAAGLVTGLANGGNFDLLMRIPQLIFPHLTLVEYSIEDAPCLIRMYEGPTVSADGTAVNVRNHNRASGSDTSGATMTHTPTITDVGTELDVRYIPPAPSGGGGGPGGRASGRMVEGQDVEWVLGSAATETRYLWRLTNNSGGAIDFSYHFNGYEAGYES